VGFSRQERQVFSSLIFVVTLDENDDGGDDDDSEHEGDATADDGGDFRW
jgi:hypothetical protein